MAIDSRLFKHTVGQADPFSVTGSSYFPDPQDPMVAWSFPREAFPAAGPLGGSATQTVLYAPDGGSAALAGGGNGGGGSTGGGSTSAGSSSLVINISWDSSVQSAPSGFTTAVMAAVQYLESQFVDPVTINISVGYGEVNGTALGSKTLGESESYLSSYSYSSLRSALSANATSADDNAAVASLPASSPVSGTLWTTAAQAKALGLASANGSATDGFVGFSSSLPFTYNDSNGIAAGTYDFNGAVLHEITEVMGRMLLTGSTSGPTANSYDLLDLFHYSSAGVRDFAASTPGYFSPDSGNSNLGTFNTTSGGDPGDWASPMGNDSFDAFSSSGVVNPVTSNDLRELDVIGWNRAPVSTPAGISVAPVTSALSNAQTSTGPAANAVLATLSQVGGSTGDSYSYTAGGTDAASFTLSAANNAGTLAVGSGGLTGAAGGRLYALSVIATDSTSGNSAPAKPLDVIVGSAAGDTVSVAALSGSLGTATPTLVYGLAGSDTIDATGMTGPLWLTGGAGADSMTGGSGANHYLYAATGESTPAAMDVITNFHASLDVLDLTGLGQSLQYAGQLHNSKLAAGSIGWQASGGNTDVYVNTSGSTESLAGTNMKIELLGSVSLGSGNIAHL